MAIVNLTPHAITILPREGEAIVVAPSGAVARVTTARAVVETLPGGIEVFSTSFGEVTGLPDPREGDFFLVSGLVAGHPSLRGRTDVLSPGELVRGADGQPIGCRGLSRPG
jgi:hypothetical protein